MDRHTAFVDLDAELDRTRCVLDRLPDDRLDFQPHEKSWTLGALATHVANLPGWMAVTLSEDSLDLAGLPRNQALPSRDAILERFDFNVAGARDAWDATDDDRLAEPWTVRHGEHVVMESPRGAMLRSAGISHLIHHRGQLTVYLRLLDVPLPNLYGPTADER
jgi:uncharacterized damage-inducible protein DinB